MKLLITILLIIGFNQTYASVECKPNWIYECGEKWDLMSEIGERIKHEKASGNPDLKKIQDWQDLWESLKWVKETDFTKEQKNTIKTQLPADLYQLIK